MTTNNVTRMLESRKVAFTALDVPVQKLSALEVAELLNVLPETVFKTIVAKREKGGKPILALVPATGEVDNKALAAALNEKKVHVTSQAEAEALTGLRAGGISPLALVNKGFQVLIDSSAEAAGSHADLRRAVGPANSPGAQRPGQTDQRAFCLHRQPQRLTRVYFS